MARWIEFTTAREESAMDPTWNWLFPETGARFELRQLNAREGTWRLTHQGPGSEALVIREAKFGGLLDLVHFMLGNDLLELGDERQEFIGEKGRN